MVYFEVATSGSFQYTKKIMSWRRRTSTIAFGENAFAFSSIEWDLRGDESYSTEHTLTFNFYAHQTHDRRKLVNWNFMSMADGVRSNSWVDRCLVLFPCQVMTSVTAFDRRPRYHIRSHHHRPPTIIISISNRGGATEAKSSPVGSNRSHQCLYASYDTTIITVASSPCDHRT